MDEDEVNINNDIIAKGAKIVIVPEESLGHQEIVTGPQPMSIDTTEIEDDDREQQKTAAQLKAMAVSGNNNATDSPNSQVTANQCSNNSKTNNSITRMTVSEGKASPSAASNSNDSTNGAISGGNVVGFYDGSGGSNGFYDSARPSGKCSETDSPCGAPSINDAFDDKNRLKPFVKTCAKFNFSGGSGSGDHDGMVSMEDGTDVTAKKRKTRRGKPKHRKLKPYSKSQVAFQQRLRGRGNSGRPSKTGRQPQPLAPNNTTQFIIEDHHELQDLEQRLSNHDGPVGSYPTSNFSKPGRTRDSSFSIDSDEDFYYSSPEDEDEFLCREFSTAYEDVHAERLSGLSKGELIQEHLQLEARIDSLTKRLRSRSSGNHLVQNSDGTEVSGSEATKKQLRIYQQKLDELIQQNDMLRKENDVLKQRLARRGSPMSSIDSESDSDSSCSTANSKRSCSGIKSPGSSPVPSSYHACRPEKSRKHTAHSVSSVDSQSDSTSTEPEQEDEDGGKHAGAVPANELSNGHAAIRELIGLPT